ncbi:hypothetical protein RhiLY_11112 [Ceratobasidium sp. AG-Ba]|nr:hypothetical protein RhiLY_11112 [Ceratobasidium sp. AG-Ba]
MPQHLSQALQRSSKLDNTSGILMVFTELGGLESDEFAGHKIHRLENIWLEPQEGAPNSYRVGKRYDALWRELPSEVTFGSNTLERPLPSALYLEIHAARAKALINSDAMELMDDLLDEFEPINVLASDGSSGQLLEYALSLYQTAIV